MLNQKKSDCRWSDINNLLVMNYYMSTKERVGVPKEKATKQAVPSLRKRADNILE